MSVPWRVGEPGYGVVADTDGRARYSCFGPLSVAALAGRCTGARKHGAKPTRTDGWLTPRFTNGEPNSRSLPNLLPRQALLD